MYLKNTIFVKILFYILLLCKRMTFCPAGTYFLHKLNDMFIFQVQCAIKTVNCRVNDLNSHLSYADDTFRSSVMHYTDTALKVSIAKLMQENHFINLDHQTSFLLLTSSVLVDHVEKLLFSLLKAYSDFKMKNSNNGVSPC